MAKVGAMAEVIPEAGPSTPKTKDDRLASVDLVLLKTWMWVMILEVVPPLPAVVVLAS